MFPGQSLKSGDGEGVFGPRGSCSASSEWINFFGRERMFSSITLIIENDRYPRKRTGRKTLCGLTRVNWEARRSRQAG